MLPKIHSNLRAFLSATDIFPVKPSLKLRNSQRSCTYTAVFSFVFYTLLVFLIWQQLGNFKQQAHVSTLNHLSSSQMEMTWISDGDMSIQIGMSKEDADQIKQKGLKLKLINHLRQIPLSVSNNQNDLVYKLRPGDPIVLSGHDPSQNNFKDLRLVVEWPALKKFQFDTLHKISYEFKLTVNYFAEGLDNNRKKTLIFRKNAASEPERLIVQLDAVRLQEDLSMFPYSQQHSTQGIASIENIAHTQWAAYSATGTFELLSLRLSPIVRIKRTETLKLHRMVGNIGNFITAVTILFIISFIEVNQFNKYVGASRDLFMLKYVSQDGVLTYSPVSSSKLDFLIPFKRIFFRKLSIEDQLKIEVVEKLKRELDITRIIQRLINLENSMNQQTIKDLNLRITMFATENQERPVIVPKQVEPEFHNAPKVPKDTTYSAAEAPIVPKNKEKPPVSVIENKSTKSTKSFQTESTNIQQSTEFTTNNEMTVRSALMTQPIMHNLLKLSETPTSSSSLTQPNRQSFLRNNVVASVIPRQTIRSLQFQPNYEVNESAGMMLRPQARRIVQQEQIVVVQKQQKFVKFLKSTLQKLDDIVQGLDFFAYRVGFNLDDKHQKLTSEVSGLCTLVAIWFSLTIMLFDILSFVKIQSYIRTSNNLIVDTDSSPFFNNFPVMLFAYNQTSEQVIDFEYVKSHARVNLYLPNENETSSGTKAIQVNESQFSRFRQLSFIKNYTSDIPKGHIFRTNSTILHRHRPLIVSLNYECRPSSCQTNLSNIEMYLVVTNQTFDDESETIVDTYHPIPFSYHFKHYLTVNELRLKYRKIEFESDGGIFNRHYQTKLQGYTLEQQILESKQRISEKNQRKSIFRIRLSDYVTIYNKHSVKFDEFLGHFQGIFFIIFLFVLVIGIYLNQSKMYCRIANYSQKNKVKFTWKELIKIMVVPRFLLRCGKRELEKHIESGKERAEVDRIIKHLSKLENYSCFFVQSEIQREFATMYLKQSLEKQPAARGPGEKYPKFHLLDQQHENTFKDVQVKTEDEQPTAITTSLCSEVSSRFSSLDIFGRKLGAHFQNRQKVSSRFTQLCSIFLILFFIVLIESYSRQNSKITQQQQTNLLSSPIQVDQKFLQNIRIKLKLRENYEDQQNQFHQFHKLTNSFIKFGDQIHKVDSTGQIFLNLKRDQYQKFQNLLSIHIVEKDRLLKTQKFYLKKMIIQNQLRVCITNYDILASKTHDDGNIVSTEACLPYFSLSTLLKVQKNVHLRSKILKQSRYSWGILRNETTYHYYSVNSDNSKTSYHDIKDKWSLVLNFLFDQHQTLITRSSLSLNKSINKIIGVISFSLLLFSFLTYFNKIKFILQLGLKLYLTNPTIDRVSYLECIKVSILIHIPRLSSCFDNHILQLSQIYTNSLKQLSFKSFLQRINRLQQKSLGLLERRHAQAFNVYVKKEVSVLENINQERSKEDLRNMKEVLARDKYHRLRDKHGLTEKETLYAAYLLSEPSLCRTHKLRQKLRRMRDSINW